MTTSNRLTNPEFEILAHLQSRAFLSKDCRRSDKFGLAPNVMSSIGLGLRSRNLVASSNDGSTYNYWEITAAGNAALALERGQRKIDAGAAQAIARSYNTLTEPRPPLPADIQFTRYRVLDSGSGDVSEPYDNLAAARKKANEWANDEPGREIEIVVVYKTIKAEVRITEV